MRQPDARMLADPDSTPSRRTEKPPARSAGPFRFSFTSDRPEPAGPPLFRRWEALGLLLLVTVGAAFVPAAWGAPPAATTLVTVAARGDGGARFLSLAPPLLAVLFAWRASGRLTRPFAGFTSFFFLGTLSALAVYIAFQLGLVLALRTSPVILPGDRSVWQATLPGAGMGWVVFLAVAAVRVLRGRAAAELQSAREQLEADRNRNSTREPGP
jgi:hypothetical protein